jgi:geranylgeranyl diphosphate synthase type II
LSEPFGEYLERARLEVNRELDRRLPSASVAPQRLHEAMRYSVFAGGKRLRPALVILAGEHFGSPLARLLPGAAAVEMIHTYSLVHDDLPALDNDDLRRGRATVHRQYDEATAILVGDALLTEGLGLLAGEPAELSGDTRRRAVELTARAIGTAGMIGGQVDDLDAERRSNNAERRSTDAAAADLGSALESIHRRKTGALLVASLRLGGLYAQASGDEDEALQRFGERVGLLFQIADDILDVEGSEASLGKTPGKDARQSKLTYPALYGLEESRRRAQILAEEARHLGQVLGGERFAALIEFLAGRRR